MVYNFLWDIGVFTNITGDAVPLSKAKKLGYAKAVMEMLEYHGPMKMRRIMVATELGWESLSEIFETIGAIVSEVTQVVRLPHHKIPETKRFDPRVKWGPLRSGDWNGIGGIHRLTGGNYGHQIPSPDGRLMP